MRIFYFITKSEIGGAQTHIAQLTRYMIGQGNEVAIMSYPGGWLEHEGRVFGAAFYPNEFLGNSPNPLNIVRASSLLKKAIEDFLPDLVSCHSSAAGFIGRLILRNQIPIIFTVHGAGFTPGVPVWKKYALVAAEKIAARYCKKIICVSNYDRNLMLQMKIAFPEKVITIHNGVEAQKTYAKEQSGKVRIIFVGRLTKQKDPFLLVEAFSSLSPTLREKTEISFIGEGPQRARLESFIRSRGLRKNIRLVGELPQQEVFEYLRKSDIFVLLSNWEGLPYAVLEAMSFGLPVIATDVGGVQETMNEKCGILVKRNDMQGVTKALESLIMNGELRKRMGEEARRYAEQHFSLEEMFKKTEAVYWSVTKGIIASRP